VKLKNALYGLFLLVPATASQADTYPLDGLSGEEYLKTTEILRQEGLTDEKTQYPLIELVEPVKADVLAWSEEKPLDS